jgi:cytochrome c553
MPSLDLSAENAAAIAAYLRSLPKERGPTPPPFKIDPRRSARGREQFASIGCASCHDTGISREPVPLDLTLKGTKITGFAPTNSSSPGSEGPLQAFDNNPKTKYLNFGKAGSGLLIVTAGQPLVVAAVELTSANDSPQRDPASYLLEGSNDGKTFARIDARAIPEFADRFKTQSFKFDNSDAYSIYRISFPTLAGGNIDAFQIAEVKLFASPKPIPGIASTLKAPALEKLNGAANASCLSAKPSAKSPKFGLSDQQREAVRTALIEIQKRKPEPAPTERIEQAMTAFNCYACHSRNGKGGPEPARNGYFVYEIVVDLGDEGRMPPALNEVGAKLTPQGFEEALYSGERYRTYMATRMPRFGRASIGHLPELFAKADAGKIIAYKPATALSMSDDGRRLVGKNALTCVSCHAWAGNRLPGAEGLDLIRAVSRLKPEWFHALMVEPQKLRPRTRMPSSFPEGKTFFPKVQNGDMHRQIDAIWAYLALAGKGLPPDGIRSSGKTPFLIPGDEPIVFRTFVNGISANAILVGFPQRVHVAFDAGRIRMSAAWTGDFFSPDGAWEGRGGNYANIPSNDIIRFPNGPTFAILESHTSPWPLDPPKPKLGANKSPPSWRYLGYQLDDKQVPTFRYQVGAVMVEETPTVSSNAMTAGLVRRFQLSAEEDVKDFYLRIATGKKIVVKDGSYVVDGRLTCRIKSDPSGEPVVRDAGGQQELVIPIRFSADKAKKHAAKIEVEQLW